MTNTIRQILAQLYSPEQTAKTYEQLVDLITSYRSSSPSENVQSSYSETDVVLITYGDTLQQADEAPLKTLHYFAKKHLSGILSTIHILPFFPYSSDDGFSITDFYQVNPKMGDWGDIQRVGSDFGLMVDAVFNHMSAQSDWFQAFLTDEPEFQNLFYTEDPETDLSSVTRPRATPLLTAYQKPNGDPIHVWTTFSADQVDLDFRASSTLLRFMDILLFYVQQGASMIRLDAIAFLWKRVGTTCIHLKETHLVIQLMRAVLDEVAPQVLIITETNVPHQENISYFGDGSNEAQMVYNFPLPPLLFHTMLSGDTSKLREWINTLHTPSDQATFFNFTASHDGIGVRPVEGILNDDELQALIDWTEYRGGRVSYKGNGDGSRSPYELNITYVDAITDPDESVEIQVKRFLVSQAIALSLAGVPAIYIHSLVGSHNDLEGMEATKQNRRINRAKLHIKSVETELQDTASFRSQVFHQYLSLIKKRIGQQAFHPNAAQEALDSGVPGVLALRRTSTDKTACVLAVFNVTDQEQSIDLSKHLDAPALDVITGTMISPKTTLSPYQVCWLQLQN